MNLNLLALIDWIDPAELVPGEAVPTAVATPMAENATKRRAPNRKKR